MPATKPKLELATPVTATFPSELSALSARTPLSAVPVVIKEECIKTPITPPTAYMDFLKAISVASPVIPEKRPGSSSEEDGDEDEDEDAAAPDSMPSTASSEQTDCSCKCGNHSGSKSPTAAGIPASPYTSHPLSAPPTGVASFPSLHIPPSPATSTLESPLSATPSAMRSPFSARSVRSSFDWEAALKARYAQDCKAVKPPSSSSSAAGGGRSVRHYREVVTRTVTYTPRMNPAPRGKRRKTECPMSQRQSCASRAQAVAAAAEVAVAAAAACGPPTPPAPTARSKSA